MRERAILARCWQHKGAKQKGVWKLIKRTTAVFSQTRQEVWQVQAHRVRDPCAPQAAHMQRRRTRCCRTDAVRSTCIGMGVCSWVKPWNGQLQAEARLNHAKICMLARTLPSRSCDTCTYAVHAPPCHAPLSRVCGPRGPQTAPAASPKLLGPFGPPVGNEGSIVRSSGGPRVGPTCILHAREGALPRHSPPGQPNHNQRSLSSSLLVQGPGVAYSL